MAIKKSNNKNATIDEPLIKKRIRLVISRKKRAFAAICAVEQDLRAELIDIKHRYDSVIGILYMRIDELDEEIFNFRKLRDLIDKDMSIEEARRLLADRARVEQDKRESDEKRTQDEYSRMMKSNRTSLQSQGAELKRLWRKLAFRYHPDLVQDDSQKRDREEMMQRVNDAYSRGDMTCLREIDEEGDADERVVDLTMDELEQTLLDIESSTKRSKQKITALKRSEWFAWKNKITQAKEDGKDLFRDIEKRLRHQVRLREKSIIKLKDGIGVK